MIKVNNQSNAHQISSYTWLPRILIPYSSDFVFFRGRWSITTIHFQSPSYQSINYTSIDIVYCDYKHFCMGMHIQPLLYMVCVYPCKHVYNRSIFYVNRSIVDGLGRWKLKKYRCNQSSARKRIWYKYASKPCIR